MLGEEFNGVIGCDYFSAFRKYMNDFDIAVQFCIAHLIRDIKFLISIYNRHVKSYARRVLGEIRELFKTIHRSEAMTPSEFQRALETQRNKIITAATTKVPKHKASLNIAARFNQYGDSYFRFINTG